MEQEIKAAVDWWAKCLTHSAPSDDQLIAFKKALTGLLEVRLKERWYPDEPERGSYFRQIFNDYGADVILENACKMAGITFSQGFTFPIKTRMDINPGRVAVSCGYGAQEEVLYFAPLWPPADGCG